ncbi:MAG: hypothetical protein CM15mP12_2960 [Gammaproteobacteria bacterium]|nr:MAG: hypothetical protein CM15mP12_2960 [Gammaproteobacteria bacterium]
MSIKNRVEAILLASNRPLNQKICFGVDGNSF